MATAASPALEKKMARNPGLIGMLVFGIALMIGLIYTGVSIARLDAPPGIWARCIPPRSFRISCWEWRC
jgi:hypothetical protein